MKFHLFANVHRVAMAWSLLLAFVCGQEKRFLMAAPAPTSTIGIAKKSPKTPKKNQKSKSPASSSKGSKKAAAGIQSDCYKDDKKKFNMCLELNSVDMAAAFSSGICFYESFLGLCYVNCTTLDLPMRTGFYDVNWMPDAIEAKKKVEELIVGDTLNSFSPLAEFPDMALTNIDSTSFIVDDILIRVNEGTPAPLFRSSLVAITIVEKELVSPTNGRKYSAICNIYLIGETCGRPPNYQDFIGTKTLTDILFHEYLHCLGLDVGNADTDKYITTDSQNRRIWTGPAAIEAWRKLGCTGDIPMDDFGVHLEPKCFVNEIMQPNSGLGVDLLFSSVSAGMISDIGYKVNYKATDKFSQKDLGGCDCKDFCPVVAQQCTRRLNDPIHTSSRKHKSSRRKLVPLTATPQAANLTTQQEAAVSQLTVNQQTLGQLEFVRRFFQGDASTVHIVSLAADGKLEESSYTLAELEAFARAQIQALAQSSTNIIV